MVTTVPPVIGPEVGVMELITGGRWKLKLSELSVPPRVVILIGTVLTRCDSIYFSIANLCKASRGGGSEIHAGGTRETSAGDSDTIAARSDARSRKYFCRCGRGDISIVEPQASTSRRCDYKEVRACGLRFGGIEVGAGGAELTGYGGDDG